MKCGAPSSQVSCHHGQGASQGANERPKAHSNAGEVAAAFLKNGLALMENPKLVEANLGGGNSNIFGIFTPILGGFMIQFHEYFSKGLVQPPT